MLQSDAKGDRPSQASAGVSCFGWLLAPPHTPKIEQKKKTLKDASDTLAKRVFFRRKKTRTLFDLQKRVLKIWRRQRSQNISISPKESVCGHFTPARAILRAETAQPPQIRPDFLKFASTCGGKKCAQRSRRCARAHVDIKFEFS